MIGIDYVACEQTAGGARVLRYVIEAAEQARQRCPLKVPVAWLYGGRVYQRDPKSGTALRPT